MPYFQCHEQDYETFLRINSIDVKFLFAFANFCLILVNILHALLVKRKREKQATGNCVLLQTMCEIT